MKKTVISTIMSAALFLTACSGSLEVTPAEKLTVEYGEKLDNSKLFDAKKSDENVSVSKVDGFDAKKLGDQELTVTFTDGDKEKEEKITVTVKDTKAPVVELKKDMVTIDAGDKLNLQDNIKSVKDVVDGDLKYSDEKVEKNGYYIEKGKFNEKKAGTYEIKIVAVDKNGNKTEKKFTVKVEKIEDRKTASKGSSSSSSSTNKGTSNSGSSGSSNKGNSGSSTSSSKPSSSGSSGSSSKPSGSGSSGGNSASTSKPSKPHEHIPMNFGWDLSGYDDGIWCGLWFDNAQEARAYAEGPYFDQYVEEQGGGEHSFSYQFEECACGKVTMIFWNFK